MVIISRSHKQHDENYTVGHKNVALYFCLNLQIFSLPHSVDNLQCDYYISHHTINVSLYYVVKYKC